VLSDSIVEVAASMERQLNGDVESVDAWDESMWQAQLECFLTMVEAEESPYRLGQVLLHDAGLDLPVAVVKATYERLFELGASDVHTKLCYARYLLMHGPEWDDLAQGILAEIHDAADAAGLWENSRFGHHPVLYTGPR
jgi:hypothetical protein